MGAAENKPLVSVVMPVYNAEAYLVEAVGSILAQTYEKFELLLINDGSVDRSGSLAKDLCAKDARLVYHENVGNKGVAFTRNVGLKKSKGIFLCWMDSDDTCDPTRLEKQVTFLSQNPEIGAVGTQIQRFNAGGSFEQTALEANPEYIKASLLFRPATVPNATIMLRTELVEKYGLSYNNDLKIGEDYDFVAQCSHYFPISILPEILYNYRVAENSITQSYNSSTSKTFDNVKNTYKNQLNKLGINPSEEELLTHDTLVNTEMVKSMSIFKNGIDWLHRVETGNEKTKLFNESHLKSVLKQQFIFLGKKAGPLGIKALMLHTRKGIKLEYLNGVVDWIKVAVRCFFRYRGFEFDLKRAIKDLFNR